MYIKQFEPGATLSSNFMDNIDNAIDNWDLKGGGENTFDPRYDFAFKAQHILDKFTESDEIANRNRTLNRALGILAIFSVLIALIIAAADPLLSADGHAPYSSSDTAAVYDHEEHHDADNHEESGAGRGDGADKVAHSNDGHGGDTHGEAHHEHHHHPLILIATFLGLFGTAVSLLGLLGNSPRKKWLLHRFEAERIRQFHFQYISAHFTTILDSVGDEAKMAAYQRAREAAFEAFYAQNIKKSDIAFEKIIHADESNSIVSLVTAEPIPATLSPDTKDPAFDIWKALRIDWQANYCRYKLRGEDLKSHQLGAWTLNSLHGQHRVFGTLAWLSIGIIVLLHFAHIADLVLGSVIPMPNATIMHVGIVWSAMVALTIRALESGFQPHRELERYEQYRARTRALEEEFKKSESAAVRINMMQSFETISTEEMRIFLKTYERAIFVL